MRGAFARGHTCSGRLLDEIKRVTVLFQPCLLSVTMAKAHYLSRRLAKEKTVCPGCHKSMQVGTLSWAHKCRVAKAVPDHVIQERLNKMLHTAHTNFQQRQARNAEPVEESVAPLDPVVQADEAVNAAASQEGQEGSATSHA